MGGGGTWLSARRKSTMQRVSVTEVVSGNIVVVWPQWTYAGMTGSLVRVNGLSEPPKIPLVVSCRAEDLCF